MHPALEKLQHHKETFERNMKPEKTSRKPSSCCSKVHYVHAHPRSALAAWARCQGTAQGSPSWQTWQTWQTKSPCRVGLALHKMIAAGSPKQRPALSRVWVGTLPSSSWGPSWLWEQLGCPWAPRDTLWSGHLCQASPEIRAPKLAERFLFHREKLFSLEGSLLKRSKRPEKQTLVHNVRVKRWGKTDVRRGKMCWIDGRKWLVVTGKPESQ